jgi:hypothetical protein
VNQLARELAGSVKGEYDITPAWRDSLWTRLDAVGTGITRAGFDSARRVADQFLDQRVAQIVGADSLAFLHDVQYDVQLRRAVQLLHDARTQGALLAEAGK